WEPSPVALPPGSQPGGGQVRCRPRSGGMGRRTRSSPSGGKLRTWRRGPVSQQRTSMEDQEVASVNTGDPEAALYWAERRVLKIQTKLCQWACADPGRRFDDLFNLVADP